MAPKIKANPADRVATDLNMSNRDGFTLIEKLRALDHFKSIPIVMLTTESPAGGKAEGKSAWATGRIVKPFKPQQLLGVIKKILG